MKKAIEIQRGFLEFIMPQLPFIGSDQGKVDEAFSFYIDGLLKDKVISQDAADNIANPLQLIRNAAPAISLDEDIIYLSVEEEENQFSNQ